MHDCWDDLNGQVSHPSCTAKLCGNEDFCTAKLREQGWCTPKWQTKVVKLASSLVPQAIAGERPLVPPPRESRNEV